MPLNPHVHQGLHGKGFIYALASAAGLTTAKMNLDVDGVDWQVGYPGPRGFTRSPKIEFQVKSWSKPAERNGHFRFPIEVKHHNHLAGRGFQIPRFLALVIVPADPAEYAICDDNAMRMGQAAYWLSLADRELLPYGGDAALTLTLSVPRRNLLTVTTLAALLDGDLDGATA